MKYYSFICNYYLLFTTLINLLQAAVVSALSALCEEYYQAQPGQADSEIQSETNIIYWFYYFILYV